MKYYLFSLLCMGLLLPSIGFAQSRSSILEQPRGSAPFMPGEHANTVSRPSTANGETPNSYSNFALTANPNQLFLNISLGGAKFSAIGRPNFCLQTAHTREYGPCKLQGKTAAGAIGNLSLGYGNFYNTSWAASFELLFGKLFIQDQTQEENKKAMQLLLGAGAAIKLYPLSLFIPNLSDYIKGFYIRLSGGIHLESFIFSSPELNEKRAKQKQSASWAFYATGSLGYEFAPTPYMRIGLEINNGMLISSNIYWIGGMGTLIIPF